MNTRESFYEAIACLVEEAYPHLADHLEEGFYRGGRALIMDGAVLTLLGFDTVRLEDYHGHITYNQMTWGGELDLVNKFVAASSPYGEYHAILAQGSNGWELEPWGSSRTQSAWRTSDGTYVEVDMTAMFSPNVTIDYYGIPLTLRGSTAPIVRSAIETLDAHGVAAMVNEWCGRSDDLEAALKILPDGAIKDAAAAIESHPTPGGNGHYWTVTIDGTEHTCNTAGQVADVLVDALAG